jgi:hypothetical protein
MTEAARGGTGLSGGDNAEEAEECKEAAAWKVEAERRDHLA